MSVLPIVAVIARGAVIPIFIWMALMFRRKYTESKNQFFNGYFIFFIMLFGIQLVTFGLDLINLINPGTQIGELTSARFADYQDQYAGVLLYTDNFVRVSYIAIFIILLIAVGSQVQPLEVFLQWNKRVLSRLNFICVPLVAAIYLSFIRYTYYTLIVLTIAIAAIALGILSNIFINLKLTLTAVGEVRLRSFLVMIGLILVLVGLTWSARTGFSEIFGPNFSDSEWDVIFGAGICVLASFLYYRGFKASTY
jgi:hypothetical protein